MTTLRWAPIALAFLLVGTPLAQASDDGDSGSGCLSIVTSKFASGVRPVLSVSDAIAVGIQTNSPSEFGLVLIVIPALCHLPVGDALGQVSHVSQSSPTSGPDSSGGNPILP